MLISRRLVAATVGAAVALGALVGAAPANAAEDLVPRLPVTALTGDSPEFRWDAVDGAVGYLLEVALAADATSTRVATVRTTTTRWVPTAELGITGDARTLSWRVAPYFSVAESSLGTWSAWGTYAQPTTDSPTPVSPAVGATVAYPDPVVLRWTAVDGALGYRVQYTKELTGWANAVEKTVDGGTSFTPDTLLERSRTLLVDDNPTDQPVVWRWRVAAVLGTTTGTNSVAPWSTERSFEVRWAASARPVLTAPANLEDPANGAEVVSDPIFTWTPVPGAARYLVQFGLAASPDRSELRSIVTSLTPTAAVTSTSYVPNVPFPDQQYYWQVTPIDPDGAYGPASKVSLFKKEWGEQAGATAPDDGVSAYPTPLTGFTTQAAAEANRVPLDKFELEWEPLARATAYRVQLWNISTGKSVQCVTANTSATVVAEYNTTGTNAISVTRLQQESTKGCLWSVSFNERVAANTTYRWSVQALDSPAATTGAPDSAAGTIESVWSDPQQTGFESRRRYIATGPNTAGLSGQSPALSEPATTPASGGAPAPTLRWEPMTGADFYLVEIGNNPNILNNKVATFVTTGTVLRPTGVFANNGLAEPYYWRVRGATGTNIAAAGATPVGEYSANGQWTRSTNPSTTVTAAAMPDDPSTVLLRWTPQITSAPADGGSRGYQVTVSGGGLPIPVTAKVEYPAFVLRHPTTGKSLSAADYSVVVAPLDSTGAAGTPSSPIVVTVPGTRPSGLSAAVTGSTVRFAWNAAPIASKYVVSYRAVGSTGSPTTIDAKGATSALAVNVEPGAYEWSVTVYDADQTQYSTAGAGFTVTKGTVPLLTADGVVLSTASDPAQAPILRWAPVTGASRYVVRIAATGQSIASGTATTTSATALAPVGLSATSPFRYGTAYQWRVEAVTEAASNPKVVAESAVRTFTVTTAPDKMAAPQLNLEGTTAVLRWTEPTGAISGSAARPSYEIRYRVKDPSGVGFEWTTSTVSAGTTTASIPLPLKSTWYEFSLRARNAEGGSPWSDVALAQTPTAPLAVSALTVTSRLGALTASWTAPADTGRSPITNYVVEYWKGTGTHTTVNAGLTYSLALEGLSRASTYTVRVAAVNAVGRGDWFTTTKRTLGPAGAPKSVVATRGNAAVTLTWGAPATDGGAPVDRYQIERRQVSGTTWTPWTVIGQTSSATPRSYASTGLTNGTKYQFRISAVTSAGPGTASAAVTVTPAGPPGSPGVTVTPTPGKVTVKWTVPVSNGSTITGYVVQYSTDARTWKTLATTSSTARSYAWTKATKGKTYFLRVYAKSNVGTGAISGPVSVVAR